MPTGLRRDQVRGLDRLVAPGGLDPSVYGTGTTSIDPDDATSHGVSTALSRTDHQHQATCAAATTITNSNAEGSAATLARSDHNHAYGNGSVSELAIVDTMPRGIVAQESLTANSSGFTATSDTDLNLDNVPVVNGHTYDVRLHTQWVVTGGVAGQWRIQLKVNGTVFDQFWFVETTGNDRGTIDASIWWTAGATQSTDDFLVSVTEVSGTSTLTLEAGVSPANSRSLTIIDLGVI